MLRQPEAGTVVNEPKVQRPRAGQALDLDADFTNTVFLVTANNLTLDGDIAERSIVCNFLPIKARDPDFSPTQNSDIARASATANGTYTIVRAWVVVGYRRRTCAHTSSRAGLRCSAGVRVAQAAIPLPTTVN